MLLLSGAKIGLRVLLMQVFDEKNLLQGQKQKMHTRGAKHRVFKLTQDVIRNMKSSVKAP